METMNFEEAGRGESSAPRRGGAPNERKKRLIWAGIILSALILAVIGWQYWQYTQSPYYQQMKAVKAIEAGQRESDKWGGKTPEETVKLFTKAIKKGDFELASKYGNRDQIMLVLEKMKNEGRISQLIKDLENGNLEENLGFGGNSFDLRIVENSKKYWVLGLFKSDGGTWKISEF